MVFAVSAFAVGQGFCFAVETRNSCSVVEVKQ